MHSQWQGFLRALNLAPLLISEFGLAAQEYNKSDTNPLAFSNFFPNYLAKLQLATTCGRARRTRTSPLAC